MLLYSGPLSLFSRKVEIALHEKGLRFERVMVPFTQAAGYSPKHPMVLASNPKGQVPVLVDGPLTLFDSTVILEYLEDAYPEPALYPRGAAERARCRLIELTADEILLPPLRALMQRTTPPDPDPERQRLREAEATRGEATLLGLYERLQEQLGEREYFCGSFSVADIGAFLSVLWSLRLKGPPLDRHPALARWYARVGARPAADRVAQEIAAADRALSPAL
ncbi:MAG TPA: glutathione S-transferase family protein [Stellaceae bacterium]|nr:glutathione S-transferase family protein [Stellaceae bacterium]